MSLPFPTLTLLNNGKILSAGGNNGLADGTNTSLLYQRGLVADPEWRPEINTATVDSARKLILTGLRFTGVSGASGGGTGAQVSPTNYPLVQWRNLATDEVIFYSSLEANCILPPP